MNRWILPPEQAMGRPVTVLTQWVTILNKSRGSRGDVGRRTLTHDPLLFQDKRYCDDLSFVFVAKMHFSLFNVRHRSISGLCIDGKSYVFYWFLLRVI